MPDYGEMYKTLFQAQTRAIEILQVAQQATEEMYMNSKATQIVLLHNQDENELHCGKE